VLHHRRDDDLYGGPMRRALLVSASLLVALVTASCSSDADGGDTTTTAPASTTTTQADYADLDAAAITFHAVEQIVACDGGNVPGATGSTTIVSTTVPAIDGELCYVLGPEGGSGADLRDAQVYADGVGIEVAVREASVAQLNELFDACFEAAASCPASSSEGQGYAAVVIDGRVVSTPAVTEEDLASSPFVITGDFDKAQATDIAAAINGI
jgi:preprotein translocase subunit SecD